MMNLKSKMIGSARPIPVWLWFFAIFAVGSFVSLLMYLDLYEKGRVNGSSAPSISGLFAGKSPVTTTSISQEKHSTEVKDNPAEQKNTGFDFYSLLPKMEVLVPESELSKAGAKDAKAKDTKIVEKDREKEKQTQTQTQTLTSIHTPTPVSAVKGNYFLQAGAFKDLQAADRMKANLGLLGIESKIESVTLNSGVWHRVRVGPFADLQQMNKTRNVMKTNSISSIMVKVNS